MRRPGWVERGAGADPYRGMTEAEIDAALEAKLRQGIDLVGGPAPWTSVEREEHLGTAREFPQGILNDPWFWDEADERFRGTR